MVSRVERPSGRGQRQRRAAQPPYIDKGPRGPLPRQLPPLARARGATGGSRQKDRGTLERGVGAACRSSPSPGLRSFDFRLRPRRSANYFARARARRPSRTRARALSRTLSRAHALAVAFARAHASSRTRVRQRSLALTRDNAHPSCLSHSTRTRSPPRARAMGLATRAIQSSAKNVMRRQRTA